MPENDSKSVENIFKKYFISKFNFVLIGFFTFRQLFYPLDPDPQLNLDPVPYMEADCDGVIQDPCSSALQPMRIHINKRDCELESLFLLSFAIIFFRLS